MGIRHVGVLLLAVLASLSVVPGVVHAADWKPIGPEGRTIYDVDVDRSNANRVFVVARIPEGGMFVTEDDGENWTPTNDGIDLLQLGPMMLVQHPALPSRWFAGTGSGTTSGRLFRSDDGGNTWAPAHADNGRVQAVDVSPLDPDRVLYGTRTGAMFISVDGGMVFVRALPFNLPPIHYVLFDRDDADYAFAATDDGLYWSNDGGATWALRALAGTEVTWIAPNPHVAGGLLITTNLDIYRTDDRGQNIMSIRGNLPASTTKSSRIASDPGLPDHFFAGLLDGLWETFDGGVSWQLVDHPNLRRVSDPSLQPVVYFVDFDPTDPTRMYVGARSGVYVSPDLGASWSFIGATAFSTDTLTPDPDDLARVWAVTGAGLYVPGEGLKMKPGRACVSDGGIYVGQSGALASSGWMFMGYQQSSRSYVLRTQDGCEEGGDAETVLEVLAGYGINAVQPDADGGIVLAAVGDTTSPPAAIYRSDDGGASFSPIPATAGWDEIRDFAWDPDDPLHVLAVTEQGAVLESVDAGATWTEVRPVQLGTYFEIEFQPDDGSTAYLAGDDGIERSTDGGATWTPFALSGEEVRAIDIAVNDPDVIFSGVRGGGVKRSVDRGATWAVLGTGPAHPTIEDVLFRAESDVVFAATNGGGVYRMAGGGRIGPDADLDAIADADDNCAGVSNPTQTNSDADQAGDACDCAPSDGTVFAIPGEVSGLRVDKSGASALLSWDDPRPSAGSSTEGEVLDGDLADLRSSGGFGSASCLATGLTTPSYEDMRPHPPSGSGRYYLVRAVNSCGDGTVGDSTLSPDPRDDVDATACN